MLWVRISCFVSISPKPAEYYIYDNMTKRRSHAHNLVLIWSYIKPKILEFVRQKTKKLKKDYRTSPDGHLSLFYSLAFYVNMEKKQQILAALQ